MSRTAAAWIVVAGAGAGTYGIRASLLLTAHRFGDVPPRLREALRMIPPAALAALAIPAVMRPHGGAIDVVDARFVAGVLALLVAWRTKSLLATTMVGMGAVTLLENVGPLASR